MALTAATRRIALAAALAAAVLVIGWWLVRPRAPGTEATAPPQMPASSAAPAPLSASQVEHGIAAARGAVERDPKDAAAWAMLAHSYEMVGRFDQASEAYRSLLALRPDDAQAHADAADALAVANQGSLQGEPARLVARALELDPTNLKALLLSGKEAFERRRYADAVDTWQRALRSTHDATVSRTIETSIAEARALSAPGAKTAAGAAQAFIAGRVTLAAALRGQVRPDDTLFVYARPLTGSHMPVALLRKRAGDLPMDFALDDTLAMVPQSRLSQQAQVMLGARVSRRGDAIPTSGDLEGEVGPVTLGSTGVMLEIDHVRP